MCEVNFTLNNIISEIYKKNSTVASQIRTAPNDGTEFQCMQARQGQHLAVKDRIPGHYLMSRSYCRNPPSVQCISCTPVEPCDRW